MKSNNVSIYPFTMSGTDAQVKEVEIGPKASADIGGGQDYIKISGRVLHFYVREELGGGATAAVFYLYNRNLRNVTNPSGTAQDKQVMRTDSVSLTASATAASLDSPLTNPPVYKDSLTLVADVTATGDWTLSGYIAVSEGHR
jgi:hypothetical protein